MTEHQAPVEVDAASLRPRKNEEQAAWTIGPAVGQEQREKRGRHCTGLGETWLLAFSQPTCTTQIATHVPELCRQGAEEEGGARGLRSVVWRQAVTKDERPPT